MRINIPTLLTLFRVVLIPFFVLAFYLPFSWAPFVCAFIFLIAAVTDWFDGYLARRWNQSTRFGAFLDPVADKVLVGIAMVLVVEQTRARRGFLDWQSQNHRADGGANWLAVAP